MLCLYTQFICAQGNCDDEGSLFSISTTNISYVGNPIFADLRSLHTSHSTTAELKDYLKLYMMPNATDIEIDDLLVYYPDDQSAGSPFDTGLKNVLSMASNGGGRR